MTTEREKRAAAAAAVKVGDELVVTEGATMHRARVTKAGPAWLTMGTVAQSSTFREWRLRRDTRTTTNDGNRMYAYSPRWYTVQEWAERGALATAWTTVHEQGVTVYQGSEWSNRIVELAQRLTSPLPRGTVTYDRILSRNSVTLTTAPKNLPGAYVGELGISHGPHRITIVHFDETERVALIEALGGVA